MEDLVAKDLDTISNILPYDYVRERMIIALLDEDELCNVYSPNINFVLKEPALTCVPSIMK